MSQMTEQQFIELVKKSEEEATTNIGAYKTKLALFALLGYAIIFVVVAVLILLVGGAVGIALISSSLFLILVKKKIIFVVLFAIWTFLRALWVKFDAPTGHILKQEEYPILFKEIDDLTRSLDALKIHQVILENNLNAAVVQHPRFGLLGGQKNTLFLGLQLLLSLSPEEMRAVLAHEFGHLSGNHSRFSGWIYRVRLTWSRVMQAFDASDSFGAGLMSRFFNWYAPKFSAYSFALARSNEYEADRIAAELTSPEITAKALINVHAKAPYIDNDFWDVYFKRADEQPEPQTPPFEGLAEFLHKSPITREKLLVLIKEQMQLETNYDDTHPALKDRLDGIIKEPVIPDILTINAAEAWLDKGYHQTLQHFDELWLKENLDRWHERYTYVKDSRSFLKECENKAVENLDNENLWRLAQTTHEFVGPEEALPYYENIQARDPDSIGAAYHVGHILVSRKDERALEHLRKAFGALDTIEDAAQWGYDLLLEKGNKEAAEQWWQDALVADENLKVVQQERESASPSDDYRAPVIGNDLLVEIKEKIANNKSNRAAWLAEKVLQHGGDPVYILAFKPKGFHLSYDKAVKSVIDSLNLKADLFIVLIGGDTVKLGKKVKKVGIKVK